MSFWRQRKNKAFMKKIYLLSFLTAIIIGMLSCKSAGKLYQKGNYDEAVEVAAKRLQKDPNDPKLKAVIQDAYHYAVRDHENQIRTYSESNNELKWEWIYNEYAALQNLYNAIYKSPSVYELIQPVDYSSSLVTYGDKAGEVHFERGMVLMNNQDKQGFKNAYREFQSASRFKPGDLNIQQMVGEAYDAALTRVVIMPADDYGFRYSSYNNRLQDFDNDIIRNLQFNTGNEFVKFYSSWDAQRLNIIPDEVVEMHFTQLNLGRIRENYSSREVFKDVVIKETVYKPDSVVKEYGRVKAKITTAQRTLLSEGSLNVSIRDNNGHWLWNDNITGSHGWSTEFSTYTGDERALSDDDKKLVNRSKENLPHEDEIIRCIRENIYSDFVYRLRNYYSRY
jgi:tetratricopeptide (TPR) repeat protein